MRVLVEYSEEPKSSIDDRHIGSIVGCAFPISGIYKWVLREHFAF